jgi:hypothetical protein
VVRNARLASEGFGRMVWASGLRILLEAPWGLRGMVCGGTHSTGEPERFPCESCLS